MKPFVAPQLLYMVTTTSVPYMYHVPAILGTPTGLPYWFRYLSQYLHPSLRTLPIKDIPRNGILYFRDNKSARKLCFPIRRFEVLWFEKDETISFLNLRLGARIAYGAVPVSADKSSTDLDENSWHLLTEHVQNYRVNLEADRWNALLEHGATKPAMIKRALPRTIAVPRQGAPQILPWNQFKAGSDDELLWIGPDERTLRERIAAWFRNRKDDHNRWRNMLPAFAAMEHVNKTPFFYVHAPVSVFSEKTTRPRKIGRGRGQYI